MKIIKSIDSIRSFVVEERLKQHKIGFAPTMGALHAGHIELVKSSLQTNDTTIVSIFVNPAQFDNQEDLVNYPDSLASDKKKLKEIGCDALFIPSAQSMYPGMESLSLNFGYLETIMEGKFREGHFSGVGLIVSKLFNLVQPTRAYFGEKDLQQLSVVRKLVSDLNFDVEIIGIPTVREQSGLAMSSRNLRLSNEDKKIAINIFKGLQMAQDLVLKSQEIKLVKTKIENFFQAIEKLSIEYFEFVDTHSLRPIKKLAPKQNISICIAAHISGIRLIDNISFTI